MQIENLLFDSLLTYSFQVFLGGVPTFNMDGLTIRHNFHGCMENVVFDDIKIIQGLRNGLSRYQKVGPVTFDCRVSRGISPLLFIVLVK